jgi:hypothetical protein
VTTVARSSALVFPGEQFWIIDRNGEGLRQLGHNVVGVADNAPGWGHR